MRDAQGPVNKDLNVLAGHSSRYQVPIPVVYDIVRIHHPGGGIGFVRVTHDEYDPSVG